MSQQLETTTIVPVSINATLSPVEGLNYLHPGLNLPENATRQQVEDVFYIAQDYTAIEYSDKERFISYSITLPDGKKQRIETPLLIAGCFTQRARKTNTQTGEVIPIIRTILKLETAEDEYEYIAFSSEILLQDLTARVLLTGMRPMGDWDIPMWAYITRFALKVGHGYRIRFFQPKPSMQGGDDAH